MANLYVADVASYNLDDINGLRVDGVRAARARYPNVQSIETNLFPEGWITENTATWSKPLLAPAPEVNIEVASKSVHCFFTENLRENTAGVFHQRSLGAAACHLLVMLTRALY